MVQDLVGRRLGQYQIVAPLGRGGMATVYRAIQTSLNRTVALKVLSAEQAAQDPQFPARFRREAESIAGLRHPNILNVIDYGEIAGTTYIVMDYITEGSLRDVMTRPLPADYAVRVAMQVADALDVAHAQGIVHRDIKPANILLEDRGSLFDTGNTATRDRPPWVMLADFGIARMMERGTTLTQAGTGIGTPEYMSPEQAQGKEVDGRCDIYALGILLFEMLTGRLPFDKGGALQIAMAQVRDPLPMPRSIVPSIPVAVEQVVLKATQKNRNDRYATAGEMARALQAALLPPASSGPHRAITNPSVRTTQPVQRNIVPVVIAIVVLAVLCAIIGGVAWVVSQSNGRQASAVPSPTAVVTASTPVSPIAGTLPTGTSEPRFQAGPTPSTDPRVALVSDVVLRANEVWARAVGKNGSADGLETYFTDPILSSHRKMVADYRSAGQVREAVRNEIKITSTEFPAQDTAVVKTEETWNDRLIDSNGRLVRQYPSRIADTYTLVLNQGRWRIREITEVALS